MATGSRLSPGQDPTGEAFESTFRKDQELEEKFASLVILEVSPSIFNSQFISYGVTANDFSQLVKQAAHQNHPDAIELLEEMLADRVFVADVLSKGPFPQADDIMKLPASCRLVCVEEMATFLPRRTIQRALLLNVHSKTDAATFKILLRAYKAVPMPPADRIKFMSRVLHCIYKLPYVPDFGEWNAGGALQRFFRVVVQVMPEFVVPLKRPKDDAWVLMSNVSLLACVSPKIEFSGACTLDCREDASSGFKTIDFYFALTDFKESRFASKADFWNRSVALLSIIDYLTDMAGNSHRLFYRHKAPDSGACSKYPDDSEEELDDMIRFMNAIGVMLCANAYRLLEFYLNFGEFAITALTVRNLASAVTTLPLAFIQLLYHAERNEIPITECFSGLEKDLIRLYNQLVLSVPLDPCGTGDVCEIHMPQLFVSDERNWAFILRAYLLFRFKIPLRYSVMQSTSDPLHPSEYAGALNVMLTRYCAIHHQSAPAFIHVRSP
ncbi:hypothetical protein PSACC_01195 [Paramicrosporidium saccamoebae]|uniref:Uncharacterized protein n=1 Tax=Paramicrosporidium saccamoebae TaxID=1246581 RepID=A0A2H9TMK6_9FUNG|nr:hypothetical protein PSACC_01195 [Paramicrosporidium saccamoebae]